MAEQNTSRRSSYTWSFFRAGGFDQVKIETADDIRNLEFLDQKLWVALACPTRGVEFDTATLDLIDTDKDGRIRPPELKAAVRWVCSVLKDPAVILKREEALALSAIQDSTPEGKQLLASARELLRNLGRPDAHAISVADTTDTARIFAQTRFNGDGVIPADAATDAKVRQTIEDIISCLGPVADRSGKPGIDTARVEAFFADAAAYSQWYGRSESDATILPLKDGTPAAFGALKAVKAKVDDYFSRCRLAAFDARALAALNRSESEYLAIAAKDLSIDVHEVAGFPLAHVEADRPLPLLKGVNPAWAHDLKKFAAAVAPLLGSKDSMTEPEWTAICAKFAPYEAWVGAKAGASVEKLGVARIREILSTNCKDAILSLIAEDKKLEGEANAISAVDRLVRYHRDLYYLLINFVNFRDFYDGGEPAIFQAGTLYLDQRSCGLVVRVEDPGKHASLATLSRTYLVYCDVVRKHTGEKMQIAAAFTDGDSDNLIVGRNGVFYDRKGNDWDATIVKIVDHPISIRQAFWWPYKKFATMVESQIEKFAAAREKSVHDQAAANIQKTAEEVAGAKEQTRKDAFDVAKFAGIFAAIGLAVGALGTAVASLATGLLSLEMWQMPIAILGLMLIISGPSMILAWLKLRQRNLGPLLDANGWAVNSKAKVNIPFGRTLTGIAKLPPGSRRDLVDPYAESKAGRNWLIFAIAILVLGWGLWYFGVSERIAPGFFPKSSWVERRAVEAKKAEGQPPGATPTPQK